jgi:TPR repeat protein
MQPRSSNQDHHALLESYLRALGLPAFLELYQSYARDAARNGLSPEQFLLGRMFGRDGGSRCQAD